MTDAATNDVVTKEKALKQAAPIPVTIAALAALVGFLVWWGYVNFFAPPPVAPYTEKEKQNRTVIAAIVRRSEGDFSKVSPEDRETMRKMVGGWAGRAYADVKKDVEAGRDHY
jgi:hypothetical protein